MKKVPRNHHWDIAEQDILSSRQGSDDAAHFFFGTENPKVEIVNGYMTLNELLDEMDFDNYDSGDDDIPEGQRNATMHRYAVKVLKR